MSACLLPRALADRDRVLLAPTVDARTSLPSVTSPGLISANKTAGGECLTCVYTQADILCGIPIDCPNPALSLTDIELGKTL